MYLDENNLKTWFENRETLFKKKNELSERFDGINELFKWMTGSDKKVSFEENKVKIGTSYITMNGQVPNIKMFGAAQDQMTEDRKLEGIKKQITMLRLNDQQLDANSKNILLMMGGFDFNDPHTVKDKYRILSSSLKSLDYDGSVTSIGQSSWPNSHFSDNTYFFHFMKFVQDCHTEPDKIPESNIALVYPKNNQQKGRISGQEINENIASANLQDEINVQRELLSKRFPLKFLWMWANREEVVHLFSLMAFRNFVNSKFMKEILDVQNPKLTPKSLTDMELKEFISIWKGISDAILSKSNSEKKNLNDISKLISILMVEEAEMKNPSDLLKTSKQIILYGAPGTGKTYSAMQVVKEFVFCTDSGNIVAEEDEFEKEYRFSKKCHTSNIMETDSVCQNIKNGLYEIIQFHPNYTYQDFIGGISPKLGNGTLSYELKKGIFQRFCKTAQANQNCNFVLIIDEINRANLSEVFGELLYALEYRDKAVNIPYFGEFIIPSNVYIIGTMNDVDKSLVTFDLALRRRFGFFKLDPDLDTLNDMFSFDDKSLIEEDVLSKYIQRCKELNIRLIDSKGLSLDPSYQIGQAYFKKIESFLITKEPNQFITPFELEKLWIYHIEPLLHEYLGMSLESSEIKRKLSEIRNEFIKELTKVNN